MNCKSGLSTTASHNGPMPELLQMKMKRVPVERICSASSSPPVPANDFVVVVTIVGILVSALTIGSRALSEERAAATVKPAAVALLMKLRRETFFPR